MYTTDLNNSRRQARLLYQCCSLLQVGYMVLLKRLFQDGLLLLGYRGPGSLLSVLNAPDSVQNISTGLIVDSKFCTSSSTPHEPITSPMYLFSQNYSRHRAQRSTVPCLGSQRSPKYRSPPTLSCYLSRNLLPDCPPPPERCHTK